MLVRGCGIFTPTKRARGQQLSAGPSRRKRRSPLTRERAFGNMLCDAACERTSTAKTRCVDPLPKRQYTKQFASRGPAAGGYEHHKKVLTLPERLRFFSLLLEYEWVRLNAWFYARPVLLRLVRLLKDARCRWQLISHTLERLANHCTHIVFHSASAVLLLVQALAGGCHRQAIWATTNT